MNIDEDPNKLSLCLCMFTQEFDCMTFKYPYSYSNQIHNPLNQIPKISFNFLYSSTCTTKCSAHFSLKCHIKIYDDVSS